MNSEPAAIAKTKKKKPVKSSSIRYRFMIFFRFVLAIFGGYYLAAISALWISSLFTTEPFKANGVLAATMLAFLIHGAVFIWVFMVNSTLKAWLGILLPSILITLFYRLFEG